MWEISQSPALKTLGWLLALTHLVTYWSWTHTGSFLFDSQSTNTPLCWGFFSDCMSVYPFQAGQAQVALIVYVVLAAGALISYFFEAFIGLGWLCLALSLLIKLSLQLFDFSLTSQFQVVLFFVQAAYLFIPQKIRVLKWLVVSSYIAMGLNKLNPDWLAGYWLSARLERVPAKATEWIAALSIIIEIVAPILLLSSQWSVFVSAWLVLLAYHGLQSVVLGFADPSIAFVLLIFLLLAFIETRRLEQERLYQSYLMPEPSRYWIPFAVLIFAFLQSAHLMWDQASVFRESPWKVLKAGIPTECQQFSFVRLNTGTQELPGMADQFLPDEMKCHPFVRRLNLAQQCRKWRREEGFLGINSTLRARSLSEPEYSTTFQLVNACEDVR